MLELGKRRIAYVGNASDDAPEFKLRYEGHCNVLDEAGIEIDPDLLAPADNLEDSAIEATQALLDRGTEFDSIFAASDLIAFGVMKCLKKNGIDIPDQVSVVGFDDLPAATYFSPALTTVRQDTRLAAEALMENLLRMIGGEAVSSPRIPISIVVRGSCGGREN